MHGHAGARRVAPIWLLVATLLAPAVTSVARDPMDRPNVVVIFLDDSGYGDFAHNGNPVIETPNISRLAAEGVNFTQFYVTSPACSASRYSLLTGRYPARSGLRGWVVGPEQADHLRPAETTLAEGLKARGYATAIFGKWHLGTPNEANGMAADAFPHAHGFDTWTGTNVSHDYNTARLFQTDPEGNHPIPGYAEIARNLPSDPVASTSLTERYTAAAESFIHEHRGRPFFLYLAHNQPHLGLYAGEAFRGRSRRGLLGDVMAEIDASVGRVRKALEEAGVANNTLVIFSSDNGPWILFQNTAQHRKYGEARLHIGYAQPFRDGKGSNWEGGHRVPGLFCWPGVLPPARQLEPASTLDVLPTVLALCGAEVPANVDGRDIRPLLAPGRHPGPVATFELLYCGVDNRPNAFRQGAWKLHTGLTSQIKEPHGFTATRENPLLFQVEQDLGERFNLAAANPGMVDRLRERMDAITATFQ